MIRQATVYKIVHVDSGKVYVGKSVAHGKRWYEHKRIAFCPRDAHHRYLHAAIAKHGADAFHFEVIEVCASEELALEREAFWVASYQSNDRTKGYNLEAGGRGRGIASAETRAKIGAAHRGLKHSPEAKEKMRLAKLGRSPTPAAYAKMVGRKMREEDKRNRPKRKHSEETKRKIAAAGVGRRHSPESIERMKGRVKSPETIAKLTGRKRGEETSRKMREAWERRRANGRGKPTAESIAKFKATWQARKLAKSA